MPARRVLIGSAAVLIATTACGTPVQPLQWQSCMAFVLSLANNRGGLPTPMEAAEHFAKQGGIEGLPTTGWHESGSDSQGVTLGSGGSTLHAIRALDGTWLIDSGTVC